MRNLNKLDVNTSDVIDDCCSSMSDKILVEKLNSVKKFISLEEINLLNHASIGTFNSILPSDDVNGVVGKDEMVKLYANKFVGHNITRPKYYDKIMTLSPYQRCPICGINQVASLDHFFAKSKYPTFALSSCNLVPMCSDCNKAKGDRIYVNYEDAPMNPYYDNINDDIWLIATISKINDLIIVEYSLIQPSKWNSIKFNRLVKHFEIYKLLRKFGLQGSSLLNERITCLSEIKSMLSAEEFQSKILTEIQSYESVDLNSLESSLFRSIYIDSSFLD